MSKTVLEMAKEAGLFTHKEVQPELRAFAKLIVEECVTQCWAVSELEHKGSVISECSKRMRKHFGIE